MVIFLTALYKASILLSSSSVQDGVWKVMSLRAVPIAVSKAEAAEPHVGKGSPCQLRTGPSLAQPCSSPGVHQDHHLLHGLWMSSAALEQHLQD